MFTFSDKVDYYGLAASIHVLIHGGYMKVDLDPALDRYKPRKKVIRYVFVCSTLLASLMSTLSLSLSFICHRRFDASLWNKLFDILLNSSDALPLSELVCPLEEKLKQQKSIFLKQQMSSCCDTLSNYMKTKKK